MPGHATVLNLLPVSETDEQSLCSRLNVDRCTLIAGREVRQRGARAGLAHVRKVHREEGGGVFAINSLDWSRQILRPELYALACMVPATRRVALDATGRVVPLTRFGLIFREFPNALVQRFAGLRLVAQARSLADRGLEAEIKHRKATPERLRSIAYLRSDLWFAVKAGGSVGHVAGVINGFRGHGIGVHVLSWERPPLVESSVSFTRIEPATFFTNERELALLAYNERLISLGREALSESPPDAIYARYALDCWAPAALAEAFGVPLILEYNGSEIWVEEHWGRGLKYPDVARRIEDWVIRSADLITVVSRPLKDELLGRGIDENRITVNPNAVDPGRFDPDRYTEDEIGRLKADLGIVEGMTVAGFIGTFSPWHGVEVLAEAIPLALANCSQLHFLLIGDGPLFGEVRERLRLADALDRVTFTGLVPQEEAPKYLLCSDFFLSPHIPNPDGTPFFGSPTKLFEYMALGKGIIASDLDQLGEVLRNEETALLVPPGDAGALAKAIERLYEDSALSERLGAAARVEVLEKHTWKAHVDAILSALFAS